MKAMSPVGPTRKSRDVRFRAAFGGIADIRYSLEPPRNDQRNALLNQLIQ
jgi:hypothetical protein